MKVKKKTIIWPENLGVLMEKKPGKNPYVKDKVQVDEKRCKNDNEIDRISSWRYWSRNVKNLARLLFSICMHIHARILDISYWKKKRNKRKINSFSKFCQPTISIYLSL